MTQFETHREIYGLRGGKLLKKKKKNIATKKILNLFESFLTIKIRIFGILTGGAEN